MVAVANKMRAVAAQSVMAFSAVCRGLMYRIPTFRNVRVTCMAGIVLPPLHSLVALYCNRLYLHTAWPAALSLAKRSLTCTQLHARRNMPCMMKGVWQWLSVLVSVYGILSRALQPPWPSGNRMLLLLWELWKGHQSVLARFTPCQIDSCASHNMLTTRTCTTLTTAMLAK